MLLHYLRVAYRSFLKYRTFTLANIIGLAIGTAVMLVIVEHIEHVLAYDSFHKDKERIYRVSLVTTREGKTESDSPEFTPPLGPAMLQEIPEVGEMVRVSSPGTSYLSADGHTVKVTGIRHADSTFFSLFSFTVLAGDPARMLAEPYAIVLTEEVAHQLFGEENTVGRTVVADGGDLYKVTGIVKTPPANSHLQFGSLIAFSTLYHVPHLFLDWDGGHRYITYIKLRPGVLPSTVEQKLPGLLWNGINKKYSAFGISIAAYLQPLSDIYLHYQPSSASLRTGLQASAVIAFLVLVIACVNFVNLSTARATKRAREIGIRKVLGAQKHVLFLQFIGETLLLSAIAFLLAIALIETCAPLLAEFTGHQPFHGGAGTTALVASSLGLFLFVGIAAGAYPALYLSSFSPAKAVKDAAGAGRKGRNALVVLQFAASIALIVCTVVIAMQLRFVGQKELGFDRQNMLVLPLVGDGVQKRANALKNELLRVQGVTGITASSDVPYGGFTSNGYLPEGLTTPLMFHVVDVDDAFLKTYGITLLSGRNFSPQQAGRDSGFVINEALARQLQWIDPVGRTISRSGKHTVIGVVKDFHFASLHDNIEPLLITNTPWRNTFGFLSVRIGVGDITSSLHAIEAQWHAILPGVPFEYSFLDDDLNQGYREEQRFEQIFIACSVLAILIALLGLLGLVAFATEQRTKEIGIRKVLGASSGSIVGLLSKEFLLLVLGANLLAWPIAWYFMRRWLEEFAYRISIEWWMFALAGGVALLLALATVSGLALRAATANPVEALRCE